MRSLALALCLGLVGLAATTSADPLGKECRNNDDCPEGAWCVAGDSESPVQRCVAGNACRADQLGACPADEKTGQLACIWREDAKCAKSPSGCAQLDSKFGIYKCISLARCDAYLDGQCSKGCLHNGKQCNGRGNCQLASGPDSSPAFQCVCENGWNGTTCEKVVGDVCIEDVGQCGDHGTCVNSACVCKAGYTGKQCEIPPVGSGSGSLPDTSSSSSKSHVPVPSPSKTSGPGSRGSAGSTTPADTNKPIKNGSDGPSALVIVIGVLVALIVVAAIIFVVIARKRRREQEAEDNDGFNRTDSVNVPAAGGAPTTPKGKIVIM